MGEGFIRQLSPAASVADPRDLRVVLAAEEDHLLWVPRPTLQCEYITTMRTGIGTRGKCRYKILEQARALARDTFPV